MKYIEVGDNEENSSTQITKITKQKTISQPFEMFDKLLIFIILVLIFCMSTYHVINIQEDIQIRETMMDNRKHQQLVISAMMKSMRESKSNGEQRVAYNEQYFNFITQINKKQSQLTQQHPQIKQKKQVYHTQQQQVQGPPQATGLLDQSILKNDPQVDTSVLAGIPQNRAKFAKQLRKLRTQPFDSWSPLAEEQYNYYERTRQISQYQQLPFCIVVPTFNNQPHNRYRNNLESILQQNYSNYHVVIINDASTDRTGPLIDQYLQLLPLHYPQKKFNISVHHNQVQVRALPNIRTAAQEYCGPQEIFVIVDGDDELLGRQVFKLFNAVFQSKKSWFVYSNFISFVGTIGYSRSYKKEIRERNSYRKANFVASHLRAFYTQLLRNIKDEDLQDENGEFFRAANDVAICIPILEMSHEKVYYIPQVTYWYNSDTGDNNHRVRLAQQTENARLIRSKSAYSELESLF